MTDWIYEDENGQLRFGYAITRELVQVESPFQQIKVVESVAYGKILLIDNVVMITSRDEFVYREMISHIPVCNHPEPKSVLVIGGGDGGVVQELTRYADIEKITLCEIDRHVIDVCEKHFPELTQGFQDSRVEIVISDGKKYLASVPPAAFDIIIVDSTDPVGPGARLFTPEFYSSVSSALGEQGIMAAQTDSPWGKSEMLQCIHAAITVNFSHVHPYIGPVPTYPGGLWSWTVATQREIAFNQERFAAVAIQLKYLTAEIAASCFHLPRFYRDCLDNRA